MGSCGMTGMSTVYVANDPRFSFGQIVFLFSFKKEVSVLNYRRLCLMGIFFLRIVICWCCRYLLGANNVAVYQLKLFKWVWCGYSKSKDWRERVQLPASVT